LTRGPCLNAPPTEPTSPRLNAIPGTALVDADDWIIVCDGHGAQMALRDDLVAQRPDEVLGALPDAGPVIAEAFALICETLSRRRDYEVSSDTVRRPDGIVVPVSGPSLATMARLIQEDICLMEKRGDEYVLVAATLCFPAFWLLSEKLGQGMTRIHAPVVRYDEEAATRVARLFEWLKPGLPIMRENGHRTPHATLFTPESESVHHAPGQPSRTDAAYWRSERQCMVRLPRTGAVLFSIHTKLWPVDGSCP